MNGTSKRVRGNLQAGHLLILVGHASGERSLWEDKSAVAQIVQVGDGTGGIIIAHHKVDSGLVAVLGVEWKLMGRLNIIVVPTV